MLQMAGVLVFAAGIPAAFQHFDFAAVVVGYVIMRLAMVAQWLRAAHDHPEGRVSTLRYAAGVTVVQLGWVGRLYLSGLPGWVSFVVLVAAELAVPAWAEFVGRRTPGTPITSPNGTESSPSSCWGRSSPRSPPRPARRWATASPLFAAFTIAIPVATFTVVLNLLNTRVRDEPVAFGLTLLTAALVLATAAATPVLTLPLGTVVMVALVALLLGYHLTVAHQVTGPAEPSGYSG